ncbi:MAG: FkbM family methyltransferase [Candidatus Nomurabacteria bacterium]|nr:FkbM family methyltransferase [Candidatus Nomurabacteria bacterium]
MASRLRTAVETLLPVFLSKKIVKFGQAYKKSERNKKRIKMYGGNKPFEYHVNTQGVSFDIMLDPVNNCLVDESIEKFGFWEKELGSIFKKYLHKGDIFLDIGANIGYHSLFVASILNGTGKVYSFEPIRRLANQLNESVILNKFQNIEVCNFGLAEYDEDSRVIYIRDENIGGSSLLRYKDLELVKVKEVEKISVKKLDSFLLNTEVDMIKIDVEGFEYEVLKGAIDILKKYHPIIIMEFSPIFYNQESKQKSYNIISFLENLGYHFHLLNEQPIDLRIWLKELDNINSQIDILCKTIKYEHITNRDHR